MQKKVIALAVAGLVSGAAFAQSNVTIYGRVDQAYQYSTGGEGYVQGVDAFGNPAMVKSHAGKNKFSGIVDGGVAPSRIGFKGEEDLGNGLKTVFKLEYGLGVDTGAFKTTARQSFVGLSSNKMGTLTVGRQYAPGFDATGNNSAFGTGYFSPYANIVGGAAMDATGSTLDASGGARWNNSIKYTSPTFSGFTGQAIYAFGESTNDFGNAASTSDNGKFGLGLNYNNGPLNVDAVYQTRMNVQYTAPAAGDGQGKDINEWYVGAAYDFQVVKAFASYQNMKDGNKFALGNSYGAGQGIGAADAGFTRVDSRVWQIGVSAPVGAAGHVLAEYARVNFDQRNNTGITRAYQLDGSTSGFGIGYTHDLSKRTQLYTSLVRMSNDKHSMSVDTEQSTVIGNAGAANTTFTAGISHTF